MKYIFFLVLALLGTAARADSMQCLQVKNGSRATLELRRGAESYQNCFYLEGSTSLRQINVIAKSVGTFGHKVTFFQLDAANQAAALTTQVSDANFISSSEIPINGRNIGI